MAYQGTQILQKLSAKKGAYYFIKVPAKVVEQFPLGRKTRLRCSLEGRLSYSCGLNHYGDGDYFIILSKRYVKELKKNIGDPLQFKIVEHPNPLGVDIPEVLTVFLEQDQDAKAIYDTLTDGKKRSLIFSIGRVKSIDIQLRKIREFLVEAQLRKRKIQ